MGSICRAELHFHGIQHSVFQSLNGKGNTVISELRHGVQLRKAVVSRQLCCETTSSARNSERSHIPLEKKEATVS